MCVFLVTLYLPLMYTMFLNMARNNSFGTKNHYHVYKNSADSTGGFIHVDLLCGLGYRFSNMRLRLSFEVFLFLLHVGNLAAYRSCQLKGKMCVIRF